LRDDKAIPDRADVDAYIEAQAQLVKLLTTSGLRLLTLAQEPSDNRGEFIIYRSAYGEINAPRPFFSNRNGWHFICYPKIVIKMWGKIMSPDSALVVFTSLGFASIFLALVIGITGHEPADLVAGIASMTPSAKRHAQFEQLDYMTRIADEAIEARRMGKRAPFPQDRF
jgi:hypothetical protein